MKTKLKYTVIAKRAGEWAPVGALDDKDLAIHVADQVVRRDGVESTQVWSDWGSKKHSNCVHAAYND